MKTIQRDRLKFFTGKVGNATDTVENFLISLDLDCTRHTITNLEGVYDGKWGDYLIQALWYASDESLSLRLTFSDEFSALEHHRVKALIEHINSLIDFGTFSIVSSDHLPSLHYRFFVPRSEEEEPLIIKALEKCIAVVEQYHPAFEAVIIGELSVKEAVEVANLVPLGHG